MEKRRAFRAFVAVMVFCGAFKDGGMRYAFPPYVSRADALDRTAVRSTRSWAAGAVLIGEVIRDKYRGLTVGIVQTGWSIGWGAAALLYTILIATLPEALAWRALFWIGILPAGLVFWIRRFVEEPVLNQRRVAPTSPWHIFAALKPPYLDTTWRVVMMVAGAQGGSYALTIWLPTYLKTVRHSLRSAPAATCSC